jgi:RNA polymerase sigma-70 factor (ECF subfamily)
MNVELEHAMPVINANAIERLNAEDILKLMNELPPIQRAIFNLYEIDGYTHDEIGQLLAIPISSSRVYLSRAKEKLRNVLRSEEERHGRSVG